MLICGNDAEAKRVVRGLLESFGWRDVVDLGGIEAARATEGYIELWLALAESLGTYAFNVQIVRRRERPVLGDQPAAHAATARSDSARWLLEPSMSRG